MTCCFLSSSKHVMQTGISGPKIITFYLVMVSLMAFSSSSFVFIWFRQGIFNSFAFSNNNVLFIYNFVTPQDRLQKPFLPSFYTSKNPSSPSLNVTLSVFCIGVFRLFNIYLRMMIFTLFVDRVDL